MALDPRALTLLRYLEQEYLLHAELPTAAKCADVLGESELWVSKQFVAADFRESCEAHGLPAPGGSSQPQGLLTAEQLAIINALLDLNDNRSDKKKCADLGIPTSKLAAWRKDPVFVSYLHARAENLFGAHMDDAHRALLDNVRSGDISSIKLYYAMTGRYVENKSNELDVGMFVLKVIEVIQKHVRDPEVLEKIGGDLTLLASPVPPAIPTAPFLGAGPVISGQLAGL